MRSATATPRIHYQAYIDGLRAIAVIAVMLYHLDTFWLPGGFSGVDVFFAISGFVVSASVSHWNDGGPGHFLASFYARRMQRIVPALLACLLATSLVSTLVIPSAWLSSSNELTGLFAFFALSNVYLALQSDTYFSPSTEFNPYLHTWSLGVEEQFYLLFPLLFFAWTRGGRWRSVSVCLVALAVLASLADAWARSGSDSGAGFYLITSRFWQLGAGVLVFQLVQSTAGKGRATGWLATRAIAAWLSLALLGWALSVSEVSRFPFPGALLPTVATLGLLGFLYGTDRKLGLSRLLGSAIPVYLGRRSYSLYLWHWPVYVVMRWTCGLDTIPLAAAAVGSTFILAELSYRLVESPFRYWKLLRPWSRTSVVAAGMLVIVASWGLSAMISLGKQHLSLSTVSRNAELWYAKPLQRIDAIPGCTVVTSSQTIDAAPVTIYERSGCGAVSASMPDVFAIGDSHALAYATMLTEYVLRTGARVTLYPNTGCTFASLQPERESGVCPAQNQAQVDDILHRSKPGDILFLAAMRLPRLSNQDAAFPAGDVAGFPHVSRHATARRAIEAALRRTLYPLARKGIHIVFEAPTPLFRASPFRCSDFFNAGNSSCAGGMSESRASIEDYREPAMTSLGQLARQLEATVWDPLPLLCGATRCNAIRDGKPLFFDGDHLSGHANRILFPSFLAAIELISRPDRHAQPEIPGEGNGGNRSGDAHAIPHEAKAGSIRTASEEINGQSIRPPPVEPRQTRPPSSSASPEFRACLSEAPDADRTAVPHGFDNPARRPFPAQQQRRPAHPAALQPLLPA
ncbi:acyltransferase family protein [Dokdonella sp.]|uniref:acyltransferase family protein n=1 Tax=Dokdonella sp. TaxID=2291710 RepID=UPI003527ED9E